MALLAPDPPHQAAEAVQSTFRAFAEHRSFRSPALRKATGSLQLVEPHQVFTLGLADLVAGRGLEAAKPTGWLYFVQEGDKVLASAEAVRTGTGDDHVFSAFNEGRFVASTADAIRTARGLPEVRQDGFELRLLRVPGVYVTALWLHKAEGTGDLLVPLAPSPVDAPAGHPVPAARLLEELASKARPVAPVGPADRTGG
jgi:hypothetical protein